MESREQIRFGQFRADSVDVEKRTAVFVISSEAVDTYDTVFVPGGWGLERYQKNPIVTYQHNDWSGDPDQVLGTSEVRSENNELVAVVTFQNGEDNPLAEKVFRKVRDGILRGASIRADVKEYHWGDFDKGENPDVLYFTRMDLLAWSIVTVPSNPDAVARNTKNLEVIRTAVAKNTKANTGQRTPDNGSKGVYAKNKTLSRFEAQYILNKNLIEK